MMVIALLCAGVHLLLTTSSKADAVAREFYMALEPGQNITGIIKAEIKTRTKLECSMSCLATDGCMAYQLSRVAEGECILIDDDSTEIIFLSSAEKWLFVKDCSSYWCPPPGWSSQLPVVYLSLDSDENIQVHNGAEIIHGKVGNAVKTDESLTQYVDLGDLSPACITIPDTCGPEGAAISVWFKLPSPCNIYKGMLTSATFSSSGFIIGCISNGLKFYLYMVTAAFEATGSIGPHNEWHHFVTNFIGPQEGEGIILFLDGNLLTSDTTLDNLEGPAGNGLVQIGRSYTDSNLEYCSVVVDELLFFNSILESNDIQALYKQHV